MRRVMRRAGRCHLVEVTGPGPRGASGAVVPPDRDRVPACETSIRGTVALIGSATDPLLGGSALRVPVRCAPPRRMDKPALNTGDPSGCRSRRIAQEHRLVYQVREMLEAQSLVTAQVRHPY